MSVYVDDARIPLRGLHWSHMVAESAEELHAAAEALGIPTSAAQSKGRTLHYDLPDRMRERAIMLGVAEPIPWRELILRRGSLAIGTPRSPAVHRHPATRDRAT